MDPELWLRLSSAEVSKDSRAAEETVLIQSLS
jgi:hypothetical protein